MPWQSVFIFMVILNVTACGSTQNMTMSTEYPHQQAARVNSQLALGYLSQGYTNLAQEKIQLALTQAPHDPEVLDAAAYFYEKTGQIDQANQFFTGAFLLNPHSNLALNNYAAFLCRNDMDSTALWYFKAAEQSHNAISRQTKAKVAHCSQKMQFMLGDNGIYAYYMSQQRNFNGS